MKTVDDVKDFWEKNPLWSGESKYEIGTKEFFEEHREVYLKDCYAEQFPDSIMVPRLTPEDKMLDLGCGIGMWTIELQLRTPERERAKMYSADLTQRALDITKKRLEIYGLISELSIQNAENLEYPNEIFSHVNCQGVIHHTPNTKQCVKEIARVLKTGGSANISVYYKNFFLRNWKAIKLFSKLLKKSGAKMDGRGREDIYGLDDIDEIVRHYDGAENPIGKAYSKQEFIDMCSPYFEIEHSRVFFFPARTLPFKMPLFLHQFLDRNFGFMINLKLRKKACAA